MKNLILTACLVVNSIAMDNGFVSAAMLIDNYSSATNDRFQNADNPDLFFVPFSLSGVGLSDNGRWATLIGPNTIISANHAIPTGTISFYADNLSTSPAVRIGVSNEGQRIGNTDLWVGRLEQAVPDSIRYFDFETRQISAPNGPNSQFLYRNESVIMTGRSPGSFPVAQDQAYGTNVIAGFVEDDTLANLGSLDAFRLDYNAGATTYEAFLQSGDSGAPLFFNHGSGNLLLLGVNSYITTTTSTGAPVSSYVSYLGNESAAINQLINQYAAVAVPEPSTLLLLALPGAWFFKKARRRQTGRPMECLQTR